MKEKGKFQFLYQLPQIVYSSIISQIFNSFLQLLAFFLLIFWYYLSMFCAIYNNTQIHLIKDTLISFELSLLYPLGIYLLPGIFRISALSNRNKKNKKNKAKKFLFNFSKFLQFF